MRFSNKCVVITGAAGGIGSAIARRFLSEGAKVCAVDNRVEALNQLVLDLDSPEALFTIEADVSSEESCETLSSKVQQIWGAVDFLVNNAGKFPATPFEEISYAEWREVCAINLDGPFLVTRSLLPLIKTSKTDASLIQVLEVFLQELRINVTTSPRRRVSLDSPDHLQTHSDSTTLPSMRLLRD